MAPAVSSPAGFVRVNPRSDRSHGLAFHHVELWCADAASAAGRFSLALGAPLAARSDLSTGNSAHASLLLRPRAPLHRALRARRRRRLHRLPPLLLRASRAALRRRPRPRRARSRGSRRRRRGSLPRQRRRGRAPGVPPVELGLGFRLAEVELYGDVVLRYVSYPHDDATDKPFLPGFEDVINPEAGALNYGLSRIDHVVGIVPKLDPVAPYMAGFTGFHEFAEFTAEDVMTSTAAESALNTVVLANNTENVLLVLSEPVHGTNQRRDQHVALASDDMLRTLREMRARSAMGGFEFLAPPPPNYYEGVRRRAGDVLSEAQINECQELGVLVDRDDQGVLLQIFTKPVGDRPTFFLEIIQRIGCMEKDETGQDYQKGACGGFGKGNVTELFKCLEEYGKSLEPRQAAALEP
ncbi:hypothetical protein HU200_040281 [Digitaria exilis]|uniref:4-hydroxyphenylpyruvate dioxygenase n=1 Tax=Digitaria exilis TaxID=1010633 RepID=A0A835BGL4_9POAL|nr:hypothetical protein HU200_040281 [Digitaria exilis]